MKVKIKTDQTERKLVACVKGNVLCVRCDVYPTRASRKIIDGHCLGHTDVSLENLVRVKGYTPVYEGDTIELTF